MCSCPKISRNIFYLYLFTFLVLILQSTCFICTTWKRKQIMEQQLDRVFERMKYKQKQNQVMSHSNWPSALLFDLANKQCSGIIKIGLSPSKKFFVFFNDSPSKMTKNAFYFILKALFVVKIFKFLSWLFGHAEKTAWLER